MVARAVLLSEAIEGYFIAAHARRLSPHTLLDYESTFRKFEAFLGQDLPIDQISRDDVRAFLNSLDGVSDKTVLNRHVGLSALWTWAVAEGLVKAHVVREVCPPDPEDREIVPYTLQDVRALLQACDRTRSYRRAGKRSCSNDRPTALRDQAMIKTMVDTGLRVSELCGLRLRDADLHNLRLLVMGKGKKERSLPIAPSTAQSIWRYLATREDKRDSAPLFATSTGQALDRNNVRHLLQRIGERAGVQGVTAHRFRHTFAIEFLRNGGHVFALQRMLGHTTLEMVNRYLSIAQADIQAVHRDASPVANWVL